MGSKDGADRFGNLAQILVSVMGAAFRRREIDLPVFDDRRNVSLCGGHGIIESVHIRANIPC